MYINRVAKSALFGVLLFEASCVTEISTSASELSEQTSWTNQAAPTGDAPGHLRLQGPVAHAPVPGAGVVGYYDMSAQTGLDYEVPPILAAGGTPVTIDDPSSAALANLNALFVTNPDNSAFGSEYLFRLSDIAAAVQSGLVLVIHDREVGDAATILPAGAGFAISRDFAEGTDINIRDGSTVVTADLDNNSLDGGNLSDHGFALDTTLPTRAKLILSSTSSNRIVTFCYPVGKGAVIYSTIPLDFYLSGLGTNPPSDSMRNIYARNVVKYAIGGACSLRGGPRPTPNAAD
jgi:hypothetical protein